jgi:hypothetical protein
VPELLGGAGAGDEPGGLEGLHHLGREHRGAAEGAGAEGDHPRGAVEHGRGEHPGGTSADDGEHLAGEVQGGRPRAREEIVRPRTTSLRRGQRAVRHVAHVDELKAPGGHHGHAPQGDVAQAAAGVRGAVVPGPEDAHGVQDHRVEPARHDLLHLGLAEGLGAVIRRAVRARAGPVLVEHPGVGEVEGVHRAHVHVAPHARGEGGLGGVARAPDVHRVHLPVAVGVDGDPGGEVKDRVGAAKGRAQGLGVAHVGVDHLDVESVERPRRRRDHRAHGTSRVAQGAHEVDPDVARGAGDHGDPAHRAGRAFVCEGAAGRAHRSASHTAIASGESGVPWARATILPPASSA